MIEFFKNLGTIDSSIISIIFAFILSKVFGYQEKIEDLTEKMGKKISELEEIRIKIKNIGITKEYYINTLNSIIEKYFDNYLEYSKNSIESIKILLKKGDAFFLSIKRVLDEIENKEKNFLENKREELYKFIKDKAGNEEVENLIKIVKEYSFYQVLLERKMITTKEIEDRCYSEKKQRLENSFCNMVESCLRVCRNSNEIPIYNKESFDSYSKLRQNLELYQFKLKKLNIEKKKIGFLKSEVIFLKKFLYLLYLFFIFGVIYPLSYIKYENPINLDYSLYSNFIKELFTMSGFFLLVLTTFVTIFFGILLNMLKIDITVEDIEIVKGEEDWILSNYLEYTKF